MKNVNYLLVAVTLFTLYESSTAKIGAKVTISAEDTESMTQAVNSSENVLPRAQKIVADGIPKATGTDKITLVEMSVWLESLQVLSGVIHKQIRNSIPTGYVTEIKAIVAQIAAAVEATEATLEGFNKKLSPGKVKRGVNKYIRTVIRNASFVRDTFKKYL